MRKIIKNLMIAIGLLLLIGQFTGCDSKTSTAKNENIEIAKSVTTEKIIEHRKPIVFISGIDKGSNNFYGNARLYFQEKGFEIVENQYSLEEIINWMNANASKKPYGNVHIVNYSNPFQKMDLETTVKGKKITTETLEKNIKQGTLPTLNNVVTSNSKIIFHSYGIGKNIELLKTLKEVFIAEETPNVVASSYYTIFGGKFSNHYLAEPFYVFYPTANSPGKTDLSKEIAKKYPEEKDIDWYESLNNDLERYVGETYTHQFSIPVKWEFDYTNSDDGIPTFSNQEQVMDWIEQNENLVAEMEKLKIPVDKFRWRWTLKNSKLTLKGRTTVLCVLKPLIRPYGDLKHIEPDTNNKRLYAMN